MTAGPTLHYSHANIHRYWALSTAVYLTACFFWTRLVSGQTLVVHLMDILQPALWNLGRVVENPLSIYEYPWHIPVLGTLMGILTVMPLLISQLLSFRYCLPMILGLIFIARLPLFGIFLLIGCLAVACRPLRFRSRIIALALCLAPAMLYWVLFGGSQSTDPIQWGFSYAPWIYAWIIALFMAGIVIVIGHYTRYKPGAIWTAGLLLLAAASLIFAKSIGFAELDYQLYVAGNNPEEQVEFHDHSLARYIDQVMGDEAKKSFWAGVFYPTEPILLREKLKGEIQNLLLYDRWPQWFQYALPNELIYQARKNELLAQYDLFIKNHPASHRLPIVLYYKALLHETRPDVRDFRQTEILRFYRDYPFNENLLFWQELLLHFPQSPEALEARWRFAVQEAGRENFEKATQLCEVTLTLLEEHRKELDAPPAPSAGLLTAFRPPAKSAITAYTLRDLQTRIRKLIQLIAADNRGTSEESRKRLARFAILNPHALNYTQELEQLLAEMGRQDPLRDNVELAQALLIPDAQLRARRLQELSDPSARGDGGIQALYELALLKVQLWKKMELNEQARQERLAEARTLLSRFLELYPDSPYADPARRMISSLPQTE